MDGKSKKNKLVYFIIIAAILILVLLFRGLDNMINNKETQNLVAAENAVKKSAILCYAIEGAYPSDIDYLKKNYGLIINDKEYFYHYEPFGTNIMPEIRVIKKWN